MIFWWMVLTCVWGGLVVVNAMAGDWGEFVACLGAFAGWAAATITAWEAKP